MCWSLISFTWTALMGAELLLIYTNINKTRIKPCKSPRGMLRMRRKGKSSTLDKPTSPGGFLVWTTCYVTIASPLAKLLLGMYKSLQSWRRTFLFHRGYIKSVFGEGQCLVMVRKNDLVKPIPPSSSIAFISCMPETNLLILLTKEAF